MTLRCPVCLFAAGEEQSENGGELYVAEEFPVAPGWSGSGGTEVFDADIALFQCAVNEKHRFYVPRDAWPVPSTD